MHLHLSSRVILWSTEGQVVVDIQMEVGPMESIHPCFLCALDPALERGLSEDLWMKFQDRHQQVTGEEKF